jgi:hypothetical protein
MRHLLHAVHDGEDGLGPMDDAQRLAPALLRYRTVDTPIRPACRPTAYGPLHVRRTGLRPGGADHRGE